MVEFPSFHFCIALGVTSVTEPLEFRTVIDVLGLADSCADPNLSRTLKIISTESLSTHVPFSSLRVYVTDSP